VCKAIYFPLFYCGVNRSRCIGLPLVRAAQTICPRSFGAIHGVRIHAMCIHALLVMGNEEGSGLMDRVQPREVQVSPIHDVEISRLHIENVEHVDIVQLAVADVNEGGDCAAQVQQGM